MKKVMAFGTFTIIHPGHIHYLEKARSMGDYLIVVVARDSTVNRMKGKSPIDENQRLEVVSALKPVDEAVLGYEDDMFRIVIEKSPDLIVLGPDQPFDPGRISRELEKRGWKGEVVKLGKGDLVNPGKFKTSRIIEKLCSEQ